MILEGKFCRTFYKIIHLEDFWFCSFKNKTSLKLSAYENSIKHLMFIISFMKQDSHFLRKQLVVYAENCFQWLCKQQFWWLINIDTWQDKAIWPKTKKTRSDSLIDTIISSNDYSRHNALLKPSSDAHTPILEMQSHIKL